MAAGLLPAAVELAAGPGVVVLAGNNPNWVSVTTPYLYKQMCIYFSPNFPKQKQSSLRRYFKECERVIENFFIAYPNLNMVKNLLSRIDVYVDNSLQSNEAIDERMTCGGESYNSAVIFIYFTEQLKVNRSELIPTMLHEFIHVLRANFLSEIGYDELSLFAYAIDEGLVLRAEQILAFDQSISRPDFLLPPRLQKKQLLDGLREVLRIEQSGEAWDFDAWFYNFTGGRADFPKNFAYSIGRFVVDDFIAQTQVDFIQALKTETVVFLEHAKKILERE